MNGQETPRPAAARGKVRVAVADDHALFRQGIKEMLATAGDVEVVAEAATCEQAVAVVSKTKPDVVLLDLEMPGMGAEEAMRRMLQLSPRPRVVIVTMHDEPRLVRRFIGRGASAYLPKSASLTELVEAVRHAAEIRESQQGEKGVIIPQEIMDNPDRQADSLSGRELEILLQAARGMSNRQIANSLHLSEATVKRHLANIYAKIGVGSRSEATQKALSEGWISSFEVSRPEGRGRSRS